MSRKIAVVGGGASGMMAAICAARNAGKENPGKYQITIYEKNDRIGKKILATGNGKCNFTNLTLDKNCYRGSGEAIVEDILRRFSPRDCVNFFKGLGMLTREKNGYMYPASEQASTVLDLLRMQLSYLGIRVLTECEILSIQKERQTKGVRFLMTAKQNGKKETYDADCVILAAGGIAGVRQTKQEGAYALLKALGLPVVSLAPALVQLRCKEEYMKAVAGVRFIGEATLYINQREVCRENGELQLTDYGVSGIPIFQLSRYAAYALQEKKQVQIHLNCLPGFSTEEYEDFCRTRTLQNREQTAEEFFLGICNKKLMLLFLKLAGIKPTEKMQTIPREKKAAMYGLLRDFPLTVCETNSFEQAQVCAGGLDMEAVDKNLQVLTIPGLYVTGELLDVDGRCGGYNLQWAFASGYVAGNSAVNSMEKK